MPGKTARRGSEESGLIAAAWSVGAATPDRYAVTIRRTRTIRKVVGKTWSVVGEKLAEEPRHLWGEKIPVGTMQNVMGYTPETETWVEETDTVFEQRCDGLDLVRVIRTINGIE